MSKNLGGLAPQAPPPKSAYAPNSSIYQLNAPLYNIIQPNDVRQKGFPQSALHVMLHASRRFEGQEKLLSG
jgi:hypothetical protein